MKKGTVTNAAVFLFVLGSATVWGQGRDETKPWEKYGLSQTEWKMISDNNIPMKKINEVLSAGIGIQEYIQKPWQKLRLSESTWIDKRRCGMTSYDIELEMNSNRSGYRDDTRNSLQSDMSCFRTNADHLKSLLFPGYEQLRMGHSVRGWTMATLAAGAVLGCAGISAAQKKFNGIPLFIVLAPDMFWSFVDFKITLLVSK